MKTIAMILSYLDTEKIEYKFVGDPGTEIKGFASLSQYKTGNMTWIKSENNIPVDFDPDAVTLAIIQDGVDASAQNTIKTPESKRVFFSIIEFLFCQQNNREPVGHGTYIGPNVKLGRNVKIGHNCSLDGEIAIGENTVIWDNVTIINRVTIGSNCTIQSGVRIGHDGYGYTEDQNHVKTMIRHYGGVNIGNDVFIGANCVIYRGTIDNTVIGNGSKIDAMCFNSHNSRLGENVSLIAGTLLYGSANIEDNAYIASSIVRNQITVGKDAFIGMGSVVTKDVDPGTVVVGVPAKPLKTKNE